MNPLYLIVISKTLPVQIRSAYHYSLSNDASQLNVSVMNPIFSKAEPITLLTQLNLFLNDLVIENTNSSSNGGCFSFCDQGWRSPRVQILNSSFSESNSIQNGGCIYINGGSLLQIESTSFYKSNANNGGSLYFENAKFVRIEQTVFQESFSSSNGGAISCNLYGNLTIHECMFQNCHSNTYGGALYIHRPIFSDCYVERSLFNDCSSFSGGAIYASMNNNGRCDFNMICGYNCYVKNVLGMGCFAFVLGINSDDKVNVLYCSVVSCGNGFGKGTMFFNNSLQEISNINLSLNNVYQNGAIQVDYSEGFSVKFTNFYRNFVANTNLVSINGLIATSGTFIYLNVVNNTVPLNGVIFFHSSNKCYLYIQYSYLLGNIGILFMSNLNHYFIGIKNCYIQHNYSMTSKLFVSWEMVYTRLSLTETHIISHYSTFKCYTPEQFGEIPCQTLNTPCEFETLTQESLSIVSLFSVASISLILISSNT